jgi:hypothetical protein
MIKILVVQVVYEYCLFAMAAIQTFQRRTESMADTTDQGKNRQEEQMAGGPVSAGAANESAPYKQNKQPTDDAAKQTNADYEALVGNRDLGTVGGGNIPGGSGPQGGISTSDSTVQSGGTPGGSMGGGETERGSVKDSDVGTPPQAKNTVDKHAQSNLGGRSPGQGGTSMGDRDAKQGRLGEEATDSMSSRAPDKIHQKQDQ